MEFPWHYYMMAGMYIIAGLMHWIYPKAYLAIIPPNFPSKKAMVWWSGLFEVLAGLALLAVSFGWSDSYLPNLKAIALWGIVLMLIAFLPVHLYMVREPQRFTNIPKVALWLRLPLQGFLIYWALFYL